MFQIVSSADAAGHQPYKLAHTDSQLFFWLDHFFSDAASFP